MIEIDTYYKAVEYHIDAGLFDLPHRYYFPPVRVDRYGAGANRVHVEVRSSSHFPKSLDKFVGHAADHALTVQIMISHPGESCSRIAAQKTVILDNTNLGSVSGGRNGSGDSGRAATDHDDIVFPAFLDLE